MTTLTDKIQTGLRRAELNQIAARDRRRWEQVNTLERQLRQLREDIARDARRRAEILEEVQSAFTDDEQAAERALDRLERKLAAVPASALATCGEDPIQRRLDEEAGQDLPGYADVE